MHPFPSDGADSLVGLVDGGGHRRPAAGDAEHPPAAVDDAAVLFGRAGMEDHHVVDGGGPLAPYNEGQWVVGKAPGLYDMQDVLGLK